MCLIIIIIYFHKSFAHMYEQLETKNPLLKFLLIYIPLNTINNCGF